MKRKITCFVLLVVMLLSVAVTAQAEHVVDVHKVGSLTLEMTWEGTALDSGALTIYRVGNVEYYDGSWDFYPVEQLADSGLSFLDLESRNLSDAVYQLVLEKRMEGTKTEIRSGKAEFSDLTAGLYLVAQTEQDACDGFEPIGAFLISLPQWDGEEYLYSFTAKPKVSLETVPTEPTKPSDPTTPSDPKLPQTGQLNWPVPLMSAAGIAFLILGFFLCFHKRDAHEA